MDEVYGSCNFNQEYLRTGTEVTAACCYLFVDVPSCDCLLPNLANYVWVIKDGKKVFALLYFAFIRSMKMKICI